MQLVVLVIIFDDGARQRRTLLDAQPLRQRARRHVAHHDLEGNDLHFLDELLAHVEAAHEMRRHADRVQLRHQIFGNAVVEDPLAFDRRLLGGVESGRIVLEVLDQRSRLRPLIEDFGLAFVNHAAALHGRYPARARGRNRPLKNATREPARPGPPFETVNLADAAGREQLLAHAAAKTVAEPRGFG